MRGSSNPGNRQGKTDRSQTQDPQRNDGNCPNTLFIVGIGPGGPEHLSHRADTVLKTVDTVAGYTTYIDLIRPLVDGKRIISTGMKKEVERVAASIDAALSGESVALVSSGDPGIYAMAGLVFEMCKEKQIPIVSARLRPEEDQAAEALAVEVIPGIPALSAGAALLGAPLMHDFAVISLSDLLTPWEIIAKRLASAAAADFVIVLYNPKSKHRKRHLEEAQQIILQHRDGRTPVGIVSRATRSGQRVETIALDQLHAAEVDMQTIVFIGSSASFRYLDFMVTPRGYTDKYTL